MPTKATLVEQNRALVELLKEAIDEFGHEEYCADDVYGCCSADCGKYRRKVKAFLETLGN